MGSVSDMLDAWVIANFVFFRASFWEEDRRLVIRTFFPLAEGIVELGFGRNIYPCVCVGGGCVCAYIFYAKTLCVLHDSTHMLFMATDVCTPNAIL